MNIPSSMLAHEAEKSFLGTVFVDPGVLDSINVNHKAFYDNRHKHIAEGFKELKQQNKPLDLTMLIQWIANNNLLGVVDPGYIADISKRAGSAANAGAYYHIIKTKYDKRRTYSMIQTLSKELVEASDEDFGNVIMKAAIDLRDSVNVQTDGFTHIKDIMSNVIETATDIRGEIIGIPTGYPDLDRLIGGFKGGDFVVIGARPSMGKTAFALNVTVGAAKSGAIVPVYSLEMKDIALGQRLAAIGSNVNSRKIKVGASVLTMDEWDQLLEGTGEISEMDILISDVSGVTIGRIESDLRELRRQEPDREIMCFIDYLQLVKGDERYIGNKTAEIGDISRRMKLLALELDIVIVALSQLSRGVESRQDKRPMMSDIRESGQIEQDADIIAFLYRDDYYEKDSDQPNIIEIIVAKQRDGETGTVQMAFVKEYGKFVTLKRSFEE